MTGEAGEWFVLGVAFAVMGSMILGIEISSWYHSKWRATTSTFESSVIVIAYKGQGENREEIGHPQKKRTTVWQWLPSSQSHEDICIELQKAKKWCAEQNQATKDKKKRQDDAHKLARKVRRGCK